MKIDSEKYMKNFFRKNFDARNFSDICNEIKILKL